MLNEEFLAGRLNKTIAYLNIATVKKGDVFVSLPDTISFVFSSWIINDILNIYI